LSDIILKGKGVYYMDENGVMHPMSFPPEDSDHENESHFYINSITGKPFKEIPAHMRQFPMEKAAMILANEIMKGGYIDENGVRRKPTTESNALSMAKEIMNASAMRFNKIKRDNGDDFHTVPIPFGEDGRLHPEYMNNHYGSHEHKRVPTAQRRTRTEDGKLINNHANNKAHPTLGVHLESAAFHFSKEFQDEVKRRGIDTRLGARQNVIEPQQITGGVTRRYTSNEADPTSKKNTKFPSHYKQLHSQTAAYGEISPMSIVSVLPNAFFNPSTRGGMSTAFMNELMELGYDQNTAREMARAPVNQLLYGGGTGKDGRASGLRNVMKDMREQIGIDKSRDIHQLYTKHVGHFGRLIGDDERGQKNAAIDIMAMLKTAEEIGVELRDTPLTRPSVRDNYVEYASSRAKQIDMDSLGLADEHHDMRGKFNTNYDHLHDSFPSHLSGGTIGAEQQPVEPLLPPQEPLTTMPSENETQEPLAADPLADEGGSAQVPFGGFAPPEFGGFGGFGPSFSMKSNDDPMGVIATIMERVQMHDAGGSLMQKYDPMDSYDMQQLGENVGMSSLDVRAIAMSLGDWNVIAKSFNTTHDVVRAIKRSCGGALNG